MTDINLGVGAANSATGGYDIDNSVKLERLNSETLQHTFDSAPTNLKKNTLSIWFKRTEISANQGLYQFGDDASGDHSYIRFTATPNQGFLRGNVNGTNVVFLLTTQAFTDTSAWYHLVVVWDTTQSTAANRLKIYLNGAEVTAFNTDNRSSVIPQNYDTSHGENGKSVLIGEGVYDMSCYIAETHFVDGQALASTDFGEYDEDSGIWKPKQYTGTYGNNGFYLDFKNSSNLGEDKSGNNHDFTLNNVSAADQATDTPTNNFCTFNPLMADNNPPTISEGGTKVTGGGGTWNRAFGTQGVKNGKWYYEVKIANSGDTAYYGASTTPAENSEILDAQLMYNTSFMVGSVASPDYYYWQNGSQVSNESTGWGSIAQNDVIGIALDLDASTKTFTIYKNGTALSGTLSQPVDLPTNMQDEFIFPMVVQYEDSGDEYNLGGYTISTISSAASDENGYGTFEYAPPSGYYALCSKNIAEYG